MHTNTICVSFWFIQLKKIISILFNHCKYATTYIKRLHVFIAKVLVTTGYPLENGYHSEVIDLVNPNSTCDSLPDFPVQIHSGIINNIQKISGLGNMNFSYSTRKQIWLLLHVKVVKFASLGLCYLDFQKSAKMDFEKQCIMNADCVDKNSKCHISDFWLKRVILIF